MPQLLKELNEPEMRALGMKISADDIYSLNRPDITDAIVQFGGGCTGGIISPNGLLITNHHCGLSQIQSLSTLKTNYLEEGFWSATNEAEIPCPGLYVSFIREITDVSETILRGLPDTISEDRRSEVIKQRIDSIEKESTPQLKLFVRAFYSGNNYYLFRSEVFTDIRFVGAPPAAIGKFGGETDNWMWPRHTGDFALFRIYCGSDNKPTSYSPENIPYKSPRYLPVSIAGIKEKDFALVLGFPGRSNEYIPSSALVQIHSQTNPNRIKIREVRQDVLHAQMQANDTVRLKYSAKFYSLANPYKKWKGEQSGFVHSDAIRKKKESELRFVSARDLLAEYSQQLTSGATSNYAWDYYAEAFPAIEIFNVATKLKTLVKLAIGSDTTGFEKERVRLKIDLTAFYKNYHAVTDEKVAKKLFLLISDSLLHHYLPAAFPSKELTGVAIENFVGDLYRNSILTRPDSLLSLLERRDMSVIPLIEKDPAFKFSLSISERQKELSDSLSVYNSKITRLQRRYMHLQLEDNANTEYPDANGTLRVSYGTISGVVPRDGMKYDHFTTTDGILEKFKSGDPEYRIPERLKVLLEEKDFGRFAENEILPVAFLTSSHTTGGNSGSPCLNAKGEIIGLNYDRIWEGVLSDYYYDPELSRNVCLDIRYALFIIEKLGGAKRIIDEIKIVSQR